MPIIKRLFITGELPVRILEPREGWSLSKVNGSSALNCVFELLSDFRCNNWVVAEDSRTRVPYVGIE
jgi:hypothetical protein